jgi:hypothetical protein
MHEGPLAAVAGAEWRLFKSESKCVNFLQSVQQDCKSVEGKFGADDQTGALTGAKVLWTCNGDGVTNDFAENVLFPDCFILETETLRATSSSLSECSIQSSTSRPRSIRVSRRCSCERASRSASELKPPAET